jgi:hypothetical protein
MTENKPVHERLGRSGAIYRLSDDIFSRCCIFVLLFLLVQFGSPTALAEAPEPKAINEPCHEMVCEAGLFCVQLKDETEKCAACNQGDLDGYSRDVDEKCSKGWTPDSSEKYRDATASDKRVLVDVFDLMLSTAKDCRTARAYREQRCWNGGDQGHREAIDKVDESIQRISDMKNECIRTKLVYYGSVDTYKSRLSTFNSKCTQDINIGATKSKLDDMNQEQNDGKKINCSDIEQHGDNLARCYAAATDLLNDGFAGSSDKFPGEYAEILRQADQTGKQAKDLLSTVNDKSLCL